MAGDPDDEDYDDDDLTDDDDDEEGPEVGVTVEIVGLSLYTHHGVTAAEREIGQRLVLDVRFDVGEPRTMQAEPRYDDVVSDVKAFLEERMRAAIAAGVPEARIQLDPGIGFGKTIDHNLELLRRMDEIAALGRPVVVGTSRKSFIGRITGRDVTERVHGTVATCVLAFERGARVFRVHDVAAVADALAVTAATFPDGWPATPMTRTTTTTT